MYPAHSPGSPGTLAYRETVLDFSLLPATSVELNFKYCIKISLSVRLAHTETIKMIIDCSLGCSYYNGEYLNCFKLTAITPNASTIIITFLTVLSIHYSLAILIRYLILILIKF